MSESYDIDEVERAFNLINKAFFKEKIKMNEGVMACLEIAFSSSKIRKIHPEKLREIMDGYLISYAKLMEEEKEKSNGS